MSLLEVRDLAVSYGAVQAVRSVSFTVERGQIVTLIGSNGAGKTTILRTISGLLTPSAGQVVFNGERIDHLPAHTVLRKGIAHSPEGRRLFARMTVEENLRLGAHTRTDQPRITEDLTMVYGLFPVLADRRRDKAGLFSGGEQQMLAIGRALMSRPNLLLLDEPSLGLSPIMTQTVFAIIDDLRRRGTTILLVEQNALAALSLAQRGYVVDLGRITVAGTGAQLRADTRVRQAYLG